MDTARPYVCNSSRYEIPRRTMPGLPEDSQSGFRDASAADAIPQLVPAARVAPGGRAAEKTGGRIPPVARRQLAPFQMVRACPTTCPEPQPPSKMGALDEANPCFGLATCDPGIPRPKKARSPRKELESKHFLKTRFVPNKQYFVPHLSSNLVRMS